MYLVIDTETSGKKTFRRFCNQLDPNHQVDLLGYKYQGEEYKYIPLSGSEIYRMTAIRNAPDFPKLDDVNVIVGHNLKFDLLWFWGDPKLQAWLKNGGRLWDTLTVQYLLDGQVKEGRSLDDLAKRYGGTVKVDAMKTFYKDGGQSKDVPLPELIAYNKEDVENTNLILQNQIKIAKQKDMLSLIDIYMKHYIVVIEMEYNGIRLDIEGLDIIKAELQKEKDIALTNIMSSALAFGYKNYNPSSPVHNSLLLFGGIGNIKEKVHQKDPDGNLLYVKKTGLPKEKFELIKVERKGLLDSTKLKFLETSKKGYFKLGIKALTKVMHKTNNQDVKQFLKALLYYRKLLRRLNTYYKGLSECYFPYTRCFHPEFNTAITDTGRLSSTNPNAQNLLPEVLDYIKSRYEGGKIIEIDASQLEVRIQAYITNCYEMMEDIKNGIDFHTLRLSYAEGLSYEETLERVHNDHEWALKRKNAKTISFQKAYGAGPAKIAEETGLSEDIIKEIFAKEDLRYPEVSVYYETIANVLGQNRVPVNELQQIKDKKKDIYVTIPGEQQAYAIFKAITKKEYRFPEKAVLTKTGQVYRYFSLPKIKNSPCQGTAAVYINCQIYQLYEWLKKEGLKCVMINEVHDSIILDCHPDSLTKVMSYAKLILEDTQRFERLTGRKFEIPMTFDIKVGETWGDIKNE